MKNKITGADFKNQSGPISIAEFRKLKKGSVKKSKSFDDFKMRIEFLCKYANPEIHLEKEYQFHSQRKWRFDFALPQYKIAIEYEGINSVKSGHTTIGGFTKDCEKYNESTIYGWRILRYTMKNAENVVGDISQLILSK